MRAYALSSSDGGYIFGYSGRVFGLLRRSLFPLFLAAALAGFISPTGAETFAQSADDITERLGLRELENNIPEETAKAARELGLELSIDGAEDILDVTVILKALGKQLLRSLKGMAGFMGTVCGLSLMGFILRELCSPSESAAKICETVTVFACLGSVYGNLTFTLKSVSAVLDSLTGYVNSTLPVTLGLVSAAGRPGLASASGSLVYTAVAFLGTLLSTLVPFFINAYFCLGAMASVSDSLSFKGVASSLKKLSVGVMSFIYFLFTAVGGAGQVATATADSLAKKSIKYAAGTYIPVAGGYISEGIDLWFGSVESLRNSGGIFGIAVISLSVAAPLCSVFAGYAAFSLAGGVLSLGGNVSAERFISVVKDAYSVTFSLLCGYGIMLCALYAFMMKGV